MTTKIEYTPLSGGLDLVSGAMNVKAGRMAECLNFEQVFATYSPSTIRRVL